MSALPSLVAAHTGFFRQVRRLLLPAVARVPPLHNALQASVEAVKAARSTKGIDQAIRLVCCASCCFLEGGIETCDHLVWEAAAGLASTLR